MENSRNSRNDFGRLAILIAVATIDLLGATMVFPLIPFYALHFNSSPTFIGVIFASFFLAQLVAAPMWGRISDRYGRRPALLIGLTALGIGYVTFALRTPCGCCFWRASFRALGGGTTGVTQAYVADTVRPEDRARALGWLSAGTNVGTMVGPAVGSFLASPGTRCTRHDCRDPLRLESILCVEVATGISKAPITSPAKRKPVWRGVWTVLCHPALLPSRLTLIYAFGMFGQSVLSAVLALYLHSRFGIDEYTIGYFFVYVGIFSVILRSALVGPIVDRLGEPRAIWFGSAALILGFVGYPLGAQHLGACPRHSPGSYRSRAAVSRDNGPAFPVDRQGGLRPHDGYRSDLCGNFPPDRSRHLDRDVRTRQPGLPVSLCCRDGRRGCLMAGRLPSARPTRSRARRALC